MIKFTHQSLSATLAAAAVPVGAMLLAAVAFPAPPAKKTYSPSGHGTGSAPPALTPKLVGAGAFERDAKPLVQKFCVSCHSGNEPAAGITLGEYKTGAQVLQARELWERVADNVTSKHMPPAGMPQPTQADRDKLAAWVETAISNADCELKDPGRVTMRRLNRAEYDNTVRDLLGVSFHPADDFPADDVGYGFDNIGDVLSLSPLLMEKYLNAAEKITRAAIVTPEDRAARYRPVVLGGAKLSGGTGNSASPDDAILLGVTGAENGIEYDFPQSGAYQFKVAAFEERAGPPGEHAQMRLALDGGEIETFSVTQTKGHAGDYAAASVVEAGKHRVSFTYLNNYNDQKNPDPKLRGDRNLFIQSLTITPVGDAAPPASNNRFLIAYPKANTEAAKNAASRQVMGAFARRAYRRPVTAAEVDRLVRCAAFGRKNGGSYEKGIQIAMQAALVSPYFLFRVETDPKPGDPTAKHTLSDYELATRLSYFLWSSTPDNELMTLAAQNKLHKPDVLEAQTRRMLRSPKAASLSDNFAAQWLQLRKLAVVTPDPATFKTFNEPLRNAMRRETDLYFQTIVSEDRSVLEFIDSDWTWMNGPLARHYGMSNITGDKFRRVHLENGQRGGVITQASVLTVTSNAARTSPVKRGKWAMENLLGTPIPPAPPNVGQLPDDEHKGKLVGTLRQRLEQHRSNPACASCHQRMDPIGFGLENYNAIGAWRLTDGGLPVDSSGTLPSGKSFKGPKQLKTALMAQKGQFVRNLTEKLLTYALGRGVERADRCNIDEMAKSVASQKYKFSSLVMAVVTSEPFQMRRGDAGIPAEPKPAKTAKPIKEAKL